MKSVRRYRRRERGIALLMALFVLLILSAIGLGMMYMANTETNVNANYRSSMRAYYAAIAGLEEARDRIRSNTAIPIRAPASTPTSTGGTIYIVNPYVNGAGNTVTPQPWSSSDPFWDREYCHEFAVAQGGAVNTDTGVGAACADIPFGTTSWHGYHTGGASTYIGPNWQNNTYVPSISPNTGTADALDYRWVRIQVKTNYSTNPVCVNGPSIACSTSAQQGTAVCWDGFHELLAPSAGTNCTLTSVATYPVYLLTSLAVTNSGSRRMLQMEVADNPPLITNAALDTNDFVTVNGSSVTVNGFDNCKCACTVAVGGAAPTCTDRTTGTSCTGNTYSIYSSQSITTSGTPALVAGTSPAVAQNQPFPYDVAALINKYSKQGGVVSTTGAPYNIGCTAGTPYQNCGQLNAGALGTLPNPFPPTDPNNPVGIVNQITYVPGSFDLQAHTQGAGVLIVNGDLTIHGGLEFYGLIIVQGVLTFSGSGLGQQSNVIGSIVAGNGSVADSLSGGINVQYDKCALQQTKQAQPLQVLSTRELSY